jgi:hypothetical protein
MIKEPCEPKVGADVEQFIVKKTTHAIVPCVDILPGTKENPYPLGVGYFCQEDNVMAEWNIPPQVDEIEFVWAVENAQDRVGQLLADQGYKLDFDHVSHEFKHMELMTPQAQLIGCEPDYDAYSGGTVRKDPPPLTRVRNCGGHVHLGGDFNCPDFVAALFAEYYISVRHPHTNVTSERAKWYGLPGIYRPKPYGIEYRTPDSSWCWSREEVENIGYGALECARYLTDTDAEELHAVFRQMPWPAIRDYVMRQGNLTREEVIRQANKAGMQR